MNGRISRKPGFTGCEKSLVRIATAASLLLLSACGGGNSGNELPVTSEQAIPNAVAQANIGFLSASHDVVESVAGETTIVSLLGNDSFTNTQGNNLQLLGYPKYGTVELLEDGTLEYTADEEFEGTEALTYRLVDSDGTRATGQVFLAVACASCDTLDTREPTEPELGAALPALAAKPDDANVSAGEVVAVSTLKNDSFGNINDISYAIDVAPTSGTIEALANGIVVYRAPRNLEGSDSLVYSIADADGNHSVASVNFTIDCPLCRVQGVALSWPANGADQNVAGYRIYFGADENEFTSTLLGEIYVTESGFDADSPSMTFDLERDLRITGRDSGCFRITAIRGNEESEMSEAACFTIG